MEYIEGEPLLDYCNRGNLSINARLELFRSLCAMPCITRTRCS